MLENAEKERNSKLSFLFIPTRRRRENSRKIAKKFDTLKNIVMASFQAKIGWEIVVLFRSHPLRNRKFQKK